MKNKFMKKLYFYLLFTSFYRYECTRSLGNKEEIFTSKTASKSGYQGELGGLGKSIILTSR
jgi:hypothetical protein